MAQTIKCHECGADMFRDARPDEVSYKGESIVIKQPGWYCRGCDEVVLNPADSVVSDEVFAKLRAKVDGLLTQEEVARIRKKLRLSQRQAGAVLGGGPRSFQKYESGTGWVSKPMANLLRLLDHDPKALDVLRADPRS